MGPVKITEARVEADAGWCLILVEGSLYRHNPGTDTKHLAQANYKLS